MIKVPIKNVKLGCNVEIPYPELVNLYECEIGNNNFIGPFVEIQKGVKIGNYNKIHSHTFICSKVKIGNYVFIGHGVIFSNDKYPVHRKMDEWKETIIEDHVIVGNNSTILPVKIDKYVIVGAGTVVTKDVPPYKIVIGNPGKIIGDVRNEKYKGKFNFDWWKE